VLGVSSVIPVLMKICKVPEKIQIVLLHRPQNRYFGGVAHAVREGPYLCLSVQSSQLVESLLNERRVAPG
jgi:hypothetical protein